ncbi:TIGR03032 family protein [Sulfitobacter sp.]|uniref:TIGR03032 family protein n=1 Tax=Sulfitobacter sp. TaxID=1903071 RepID=UPI003EF612F1
MPTQTDAAQSTSLGPILQYSSGFPEWLADNDCSLGLTTYQAGRLILIGRKPDGTVRAHERLLEGCKGLWSDGQTVWASGTHTLWRFENGLHGGKRTSGGVDRMFVPREGRVTGKIDIHEIGMGNPVQFGGTSGAAPIFVSSAFNCLATISETASFQALWRPPFITAKSGGDRCHLNGLAMEGSRAACVTMTSTSDDLAGWREDRKTGGVLMDIDTIEPIATGLSMPHSPRLYDGNLWVLNSGHGTLCTVDQESGTTTPVAFCPGFARGLSFIGRHAVIGTSLPRRNAVFEGLELDDSLAKDGTSPVCGLQIVNIDTGQTVHWLRFEHTIEELFDIAILPAIRQPEAIGFQGEKIETFVNVDEL